MFSTCLTRRATTALTSTAAATTTVTSSRTTLGRTFSSSWRGLSISRDVAGTISGSASSDSVQHRQQHHQQQQQVRWKSTGGGTKKKSFKPRGRSRGSGYYARLDRTRGENAFRPKKIPGPKEPNDIKTPLPRIDRSQIRIRDTLDADEEDDLTPLGTLMGGALRALRAEAGGNAGTGTGAVSDYDLDALESKLRTMDFFTSADGSTEDLVGARRAVAAETYDHSGTSPEEMLQRIDELVDEERVEYMDLPKTEFAATATRRGDSENLGATAQIPRNQLAHGDW